MSTVMPTRPSLDTAPDTPRDAASTPGVSAVSWGAIFAGAAAAAALSLILLILGTGLGLSSVSPWVGQGATATAMGVSTILWLTVTQLAASGMGGYLAGRLRTRWVAVHTDEVYFRDTAHGFLAWAVATLITAAVLTSAIGSIVGAGAQAGASLAGGAASTAAAGALATGASAFKADAASSGGGSATDSGMGYYVDALFRKESRTETSASSTSPNVNPTGAGAESARPAAAQALAVTRIFVTSLRAGSLSAEDSRYVAQLVAQDTGLTPAEAQARVNETYETVQSRLKDAESSARDAADKARKASSTAALWLFVSLLAGAFVASLAATYGGRQRDL